LLWQNHSSEHALVANNLSARHRLYGDELTDYLQQEHVQKSDFAKAITTARELFGIESVRGYAGGIPQVFTDCNSGLASQEKVLDLLYPKQCYGQPIIRDNG
jgi:hypothetical protein